MYIYKSDNAITFEHQSISLFWDLKYFLEKGTTGVPFQINIP